MTDRDWRKAKAPANNKKAYRDIQRVPCLDTPEHDKLYRKFNVPMAKDKLIRSHKQGRQWLCKCKRWHKTPEVEHLSMGLACPLCGDVPPTAGIEK